MGPAIISLNNPFGIPAPGIPSDWSDLTGYINTIKVGRSCHSEIWRVTSTYAK